MKQWNNMNWRQRKEVARLGTAIREELRAKGQPAPKFIKDLVNFVSAQLKVSREDVTREPFECFWQCLQQMKHDPTNTPGRLVTPIKQPELRLRGLWGPSMDRLQGMPKLIAMTSKKENTS